MLRIENIRVVLKTHWTTLVKHCHGHDFVKMKDCLHRVLYNLEHIGVDMSTVRKESKVSNYSNIAVEKSKLSKKMKVEARSRKLINQKVRQFR